MKRVLTILLAALGLNAAILYAVLWQGQVHLYEENELIENLQAVCYIGATFFTLWALLQLKGFERWLAGVFTFANVAFFLREVDVAEMDIAPMVNFFFGGMSKDILMTLVFLALVARFAVAFRHHLREFWQIVRSRISLLVIGGCLLLALGSFCEEVEMPFMEELAELNGALLIMTAAFFYALSPRELTAKVATHPGWSESRPVRVKPVTLS
ncbi:MAG: hypothetical protein Q7P63_02775 [Verrucomicrobiota bacterium JB022]|nr:hypothetical protein [Verrucomicrobiota bacterium JB022]